MGFACLLAPVFFLLHRVTCVVMSLHVRLPLIMRRVLYSSMWVCLFVVSAQTDMYIDAVKKKADDLVASINSLAVERRKELMG